MIEVFETVPVTFKLPPSSGCWIISGDLQFHVAKRPNWLHRLMTRWLLGWEWRDKT